MRRSWCLMCLWVLVAAGLTGCGPTCGEVARDLRQTVAAWPAAALPAADLRPGPHAVLSLPTAVVEGMLKAGTHAELRRLDLPLVSGAGPLTAGLGNATLTLSEVKLVPGPTGAALSLAATLNLGETQTPTGGGPSKDRRPEDDLRLRLRAVVDLAPEVYAEGVQLRLDPGRVRDVALDLSPAAAQALGLWLHDRLPEAVQAEVSPLVVALLLPAVVEGLSGAAWSALRSLLEDTVPGPVLRWPLPAGFPNPTALKVVVDGPRVWLAVSVRGGGAAMDRVPVDVGAKAGVTALLGLSGPVLAAVAGAAINAGLVPGRFDASGQPDPVGPVQVLPAWGEGARPAQVRAWHGPDRCMAVTLAGRPHAAAAGGEVQFSLSDLEAQAVWGSPQAIFGAWWSSSMPDARALRLRGTGALAVGEVPLGWDIREARFDAAGLWLSGGVYWDDSRAPRPPDVGP